MILNINFLGWCKQRQSISTLNFFAWSFFSASSTVIATRNCHNTLLDVVSMESAFDGDVASCSNIPNGTHSLYFHLNRKIRSGNTSLNLHIGGTTCIPPSGISVSLAACKGTSCSANAVCFVESPKSPTSCVFRCSPEKQILADTIIVFIQGKNGAKICELSF